MNTQVSVKTSFDPALSNPLTAEIITICETEKAQEEAIQEESSSSEALPIFLKYGYFWTIAGLLCPPFLTILMVIAGVGRLRHIKKNDFLYSHYACLFNLSRQGLPISILMMVCLMGTLYFGFLSPLSPLSRAFGYIGAILALGGLGLFHTRRCLKGLSYLRLRKNI